MKISTPKVLFLALIAISVLQPSLSRACNLSYISLCGVTSGPGPNWTICVEACTGYGRTGATKGAGDDTRSISFGWYDADTGFSVISFLPASIISGRGFSNCEMLGVDIGAQGIPYNSQGTIIYVDPGYYNVPPCNSQPFGCVSLTSLCGNASQQCITYTFVVNQVPDSLRLFGVEGGGNPVAGCYPDADMLIDFTTLAVEWGSLEGRVQQQSVQLKWTTATETNSDLFVVERAVGGGNYQEIGTVAAAGNSSTLLHYEFFDLAPMPGINRYRLMQVDKQGNMDFSPSVEVNFEGPAGLAWGAIGPNPANDYINLTFFDDSRQTLTLMLHDAQGKSVIRKEIASVPGANTLQIALSGVERGVYFVSLQGESGQLTKKVVRQ
jgi:hypothetical protein